ncbi:MAG: YigZ family protein [Oscillospiraceae bacterium]|nr:YigZ family protein [Oscillospiraceae bacterium]
MDEYLTIENFGESIYIEKKSRFLGHCKRVTSKEQAIEYINEIKNRYKDASHNVSAYNIRGNISHSSDDGEPAGTAGVPVLETMLKADIVDAAVVVTRYYGGTPLGAGGLIRAYSSTASAALRDAKVVVMTQCVKYDVAVVYSSYDKLLKLLEDLQITITDREFLDIVKLKIITVKDKEQTLLNSLNEFFRGSGEVTFTGEEFLAHQTDS